MLITIADVLSVGEVAESRALLDAAQWVELRARLIGEIGLARDQKQKKLRGNIRCCWDNQNG